VHLTLGILRKSQAVSYALSFFWLDGFAVPTPAQVTQTVGRLPIETRASKEIKQRKGYFCKLAILMKYFLANMLLVFFLGASALGLLMNFYVKSQMNVDQLTMSPSNMLCGSSVLIFGVFLLFPANLQKSFFLQTWLWKHVDIILYFIKRIFSRPGAIFFGVLLIIMGILTIHSAIWAFTQIIISRFSIN
jgi:hypothetical protein